MIVSEFTATHVAADGQEIVRLDRAASGDDPAVDLPDEIGVVLGAGLRPSGEGEEVRLVMARPPMHVTLGISTHFIRPRTKSRVLARLWPEGETPDVRRKAAYLLVKEGRCVLRLSPFTGIVASRD